MAVLASCSADHSEEPRATLTMQLQPSVAGYEEVVRQPTTRSWTPPTGFYPYSSMASWFPSQENITNRNIGIYFTRGTSADLTGQFIYVASKDEWWTTIELEQSGVIGNTYYLYGYVPFDRSITTTLTPPAGGFSAGATLTLSGLPTVTPTEVCVVVGVKKGSSADNDGGIKLGQFDYELNSGDNNYVFLLFDHIYSALRLRINVNEDYNALRTIRLKRMTLTPYEGDAAVKSATTATVSLSANPDGLSPINSITFTPDATSADVDEVVLFEPAEGTDGIDLTTTYTDFCGNFMPQGITRFKLVSEYDVYDKQGNLVRPDQRAENKLDIATLFPPASQLMHGRMFTLNLTVNPTYLYVLSEPDLQFDY